MKFDVAIGLMINRDIAEKWYENNYGRVVKLLSFKHTLATDHIIQCPT